MALVRANAHDLPSSWHSGNMDWLCFRQTQRPDGFERRLWPSCCIVGLEDRAHLGGQLIIEVIIIGIVPFAPLFPLFRCPLYLRHLLLHVGHLLPESTLRLLFFHNRFLELGS